MKNIVFFILIIVIALCLAGSAASKTGSDINAKVAQLDIDTATLDDVIQIFGEPMKYSRGNKTFTKDNLPSTYIVDYPNGFRVVMSRGKISELRFEEPGAEYVFEGELRVGSLLDEVLEVIGQPTETVDGKALPNIARDGVLYKDINGRRGYCYYSRRD